MFEHADFAYPSSLRSVLLVLRGVLYTSFHSLGLLLLAVLIALYDTKKMWKIVLLGILAILLMVAVGGANYITGLTITILCILATLWVFYRKHSKKWLYLCNTILYIVLFALNVLAPGNQRRLEVAGAEHVSAIAAILRSLKEAASYVVANTILPCIILAAMFLPLFIHIVKKSGYKYPYPVLITLLSFGVFAAQFTSTLYTLGILGAGRVLNLYRFNFYIFIYGNELYWTGWLVRRMKERYELVQKNHSKWAFDPLLPGWCLGGILLIFSLYVWAGDTLTSLSALQSLRYGFAEVYYQENQARLELLEDDTIKDVILEPFTYTPYLLYFGDITKDPDDWVNYTMAHYFGKDSVRLDQ